MLKAFVKLRLKSVFRELPIMIFTFAIFSYSFKFTIWIFSKGYV